MNPINSFKGSSKSISAYHIFAIVSVISLIAVVITFIVSENYSISSSFNSQTLGNWTSFSNWKQAPKTSSIDNPYTTANSTLGFGDIFYINIPGRYVHDDLIGMQSAISGLKTTKFTGAIGDDLDIITPEGEVADPGDENNDHLPNKAKPANGVPPYSRSMHGPQGACILSHSILWRKLLQSDKSTMLILEADAMWDINIRKIMYHFSIGLRQFMAHRNTIPPEAVNASNADFHNDPYLADNWDMLNFGGCFVNNQRSRSTAQYYDPYAPADSVFFKAPISPRRRVIRWRADESCITAYAISRRGALKLLTKYNVDAGMPADILICELVNRGELDIYTVFPAIVAQWYYRPGIGSGMKNSDISIEHNEDGDKKKSDAKSWAKTKKQMRPWTYGNHQLDINFRDNALFSLRDMLFGDEPENMEEIDINDTTTNNTTTDNNNDDDSNKEVKEKIQKSGAESAAEEDDQKMIFWSDVEIQPEETNPEKS